MAIVLSGSLILSGSLTATGGVTISGSIASASYASTGSYSFNALTSSNALTASSADTLYVRNNLTALGTITAQTLNVQQVTSSVQFITGSTKFGSLQANTHEFTGSVGVTGSITAVNLTVSNTSDTYPEFKTSPVDADVILGFSNTGDASNGWGIGRRNNGEFWIANYTGNFNSGTRTTPLVVSTTGAATFSNSITANDSLTLTGNYPAIQLTATSGTNFYIESSYTSNRLGLGVVGSSPIMSLLSSGNVGIGTASPSYTLDVRVVGFGIQHYGNSTNILRTYAGSGYQIIEATNSGVASQFGYEAGAYFLETAATRRMYVSTAGNIGIGTSSPLAATGYTSISVNNSSNGGIIDLQTNGTSVARLGNNGTSLAFLETRTATPLYISTNDTTRIVVSSGGDVYVGGATSLPGAGSATTGVGMTPSGALTAQRNAATVGFFGRGTNDGELFAFYRGTSQVGAISVSTTGTSFTSTSNGGLTVLNSNGNVGIGASSAPVYKLEVSTSSGSQRIRVGTLQNNNNTATFEAITSSDISTATAGWIRANYGGGLAIGTSTYAKTGGDSGNFANLSSEAASTAITVNGGQTGIGGALPKSELGTSSKLSVNGGATIGASGTSNTSALNLGIAIDAIDGGLTLLFLASRNTAAGTSTASAVYIISFYYNGSNFPTISYLGGTSDFVSFGSSGGKLTATNAAGGNVNYSWFASK